MDGFMQHKLDRYTTNDFQVYVQKERNEMLKYVPTTASRILDVGCAVGSFGHLLKSQRSVEVWGVEINETAAEAAREKLDVVICGSFSDVLDLPPHSFDTIIFNDVLEHLIDPYSALSHCQTLLRKNGRIVASIPNVRYFDNIWKLLVHKDWKYTDFGILDRTHLRFFTKKSILDMFKSLEFDVEVMEGINPLETQHQYHLRKFKMLNTILFNQIADMRYLQFAVVAYPNSSQNIC